MKQGRWRVTRYVMVTTVLALLSLVAARPARAGAERFAYSIAIEGPIQQRTENDLRQAIGAAGATRAAMLLVRLDTPGGVAENTREMVRAMIAAPMPVIVYVHPSGGRADSAGMMLALAADVAAMAPATNIGSATPIRAVIDPARSPEEARALRTAERKFTNSTVAFARSLAEEHGRNADLAERMIRDAVNVSATGARRAGLVDMIAATPEQLLRRLDGFAVRGGKAQRLRTAGVVIRSRVAAAPELADDIAAADSSFLRALLLVGGPALTLVLVVVGTQRGRRSHRRRRRRRRALQRERERERSRAG
ncbi:MAG: hypothetical protein ACLGI5_03320 [Thermoleophilia bacterium]